MKFKFEIECDNDAFYGADCEREVQRILMQLGQKMRSGDAETKESYILRDANGNRVGTASFVGEKL